MKRLGVVLLVVGIVAILVGLFPGALTNLKATKPGFGPMQTAAVVAGAVLAVVGILMAKCGKACGACRGPGAEGEEEPSSRSEPAEEGEKKD